jgi:hypothetical protein
MAENKNETENQNDEVVEVDGGLSQDNAVLLLAAAEELDLPPEVVETTGSSFRAPKNVVSKAGLDEVKHETVEETIKREEAEAKEREEAVEIDQGSFAADRGDDSGDDKAAAKKAAPAAKKAAAKDKE